MKIIHTNTLNGNFTFDIDGVKINSWTSFDRSIISLESYGHSHNFEKNVFKENDIEDMIKFFQTNETFVKTFISQAVAKEAIEESYNILPKKYLVGLGEDDEILIVKVDLSQGYTSVTYSSITPESYESLVDMRSPSSIEYYMQAMGKTEEEAEACVVEDIRVNGIEAVADISLFSDSFNFEGKDYYFDSIGGGSLNTSNVKKVFPKNKELKRLIKLHAACFHNKGTHDQVEALWLYTQLKSSDDYKKDVLALGLEIIKKRLK